MIEYIDMLSASMFSSNSFCVVDRGNKVRVRNTSRLTHIRTHACTHARTHAHTHTHMPFESFIYMCTALWLITFTIILIMHLFVQLSNTHSDYYFICQKKCILKINQFFVCISIKLLTTYIVTTTDGPGSCVGEVLYVGVFLFGISR